MFCVQCNCEIKRIINLDHCYIVMVPEPGKLKGNFFLISFCIVLVIAMTSSVSYLKGLRTRVLNTLTNEIKNGRSMLLCEKDKIDIEEYIIKVNRCIEKIDTYCCKLETQTERLAEKVEDKEKEFIELCIDENQALSDSSEDCCADLKLFKEWLLKARVKTEPNPLEKSRFYRNGNIAKTNANNDVQSTERTMRFP